MRRSKEPRELQKRLSSIDYKSRYIHKVYVQLQEYGLNGSLATRISHDKVFLEMLDQRPDDVMYESPSFWAKLLMQRYNIEVKTTINV